MRKALMITLVATGLFAGAGTSFGQPVVEFEWTPEVETGFYGRVTREPVRRAPRAGFNVSVGAVIPEDVELQ